MSDIETIEPEATVLSGHSLILDGTVEPLPNVDPRPMTAPSMTVTLSLTITRSARVQPVSEAPSPTYTSSQPIVRWSRALAATMDEAPSDVSSSTTAPASIVTLRPRQTGPCT